MSLRQRAGFSLVELMIVLVVGGIILAFSLPAFNRYLTGANVRDAANVLEGEMRLARQRAVSKDVRAWVYYQPGANYYWTGEQPRSGTSWGALTWRGPLYLQDRIVLSSANFGGYNYFFYGPDGRPSVGGPAVSGSCVIASNVAGQPDTARVNLDLSGSVWQ